MVGIVDEMIYNNGEREDKNIEKLIDYAERFNVSYIVKREIMFCNKY